MNSEVRRLIREAAKNLDAAMSEVSQSKDAGKDEWMRRIDEIIKQLESLLLLEIVIKSPWPGRAN